MKSNLRLFTNILLIFCLLFFFLSLPARLNACTSAIFSGKVTKDGRPVMWKHRDTGQRNNKLEYYKGEKFAFVALVNSNNNGNSAWGGVNETGFAIMNTASYNLREDQNITKGSVSLIMFKALALCSDLSDFEELLKKHNTPLGLETNFGVIDANGGAAYYEAGDSGWNKLDVNDPKIAPSGFIAHTNFSFTGRYDQGKGYVRYNTASEIINEAILLNQKISPEWISSELSRSFRHSLLGIDLKKDLILPNGFFIDQDFIPRLTSTSAIIVQGVNPGENPLFATMWTILGYPPLGIAIPVMVSQKIPHYMTGNETSENAIICDMALKIKDEKIFSIVRGNGQNYFNFSNLYNPCYPGTSEANPGYMQLIAPVERQLFREFESFIARCRDKGKIISKELSKIQDFAFEGYKRALDH